MMHPEALTRHPVTAPVRAPYLAMPSTVLVEACVDTLESALIAQSAGASRIELCADLYDGGTTPSAGTIDACHARLTVPVFVIIRSRGGDFLYGDNDMDVMIRDIAHARALGAGGIVIGALRPDGAIDVSRTAALVEAARPLPVTFHRAFDVCPDQQAALETLISLGIERVLSSGAAATAAEGTARLAALVRQAAGRIVVMAGGGVNAGNVGRVVAESGVHEVHVRCATPLRAAITHSNPSLRLRKNPPPDESERLVTSHTAIESVVREANPPS
jgi:copper homeostasis protein